MSEELTVSQLRRLSEEAWTKSRLLIEEGNVAAEKSRNLAWIADLLERAQLLEPVHPLA